MAVARALARPLSVVAHELAHLSQRHFARGIEEQRNQAMPNIAAMLAAVLIGIVGGGDAVLAAVLGASGRAKTFYRLARQNLLARSAATH